MTKKTLRKELAKAQAELAVLKDSQKALSLAEYRNTRYRRQIERLTGGKFVFGFDPTDIGMIEGNENTYGWFLTEVSR